MTHCLKPPESHEGVRGVNCKIIDIHFTVRNVIARTFAKFRFHYYFKMDGGQKCNKREQSFKQDYDLSKAKITNEHRIW